MLVLFYCRQHWRKESLALPMVSLPITLFLIVTVYKNKLVIYYLTLVVEIGYYEATLKLAGAYSTLVDWYGRKSRDEIYSSLKSASSFTVV